jgi:hypothetical protein
MPYLTCPICKQYILDQGEEATKYMNTLRIVQERENKWIEEIGYLRAELDKAKTELNKANTVIESLRRILP